MSPVPPAPAPRIVFVHGDGAAGASAWPEQHRLAGRWDCLFLRRRGHEHEDDDRAGDAEADAASVLQHLGDAGSGHLVAHAEGAVSAMLAAVADPARVRSLVLCEPAAFSLTRDLPVTAAYLDRVVPLTAERTRLPADEYARRLTALRTGRDDGAPTGAAADRLARRQPSWEAPLTIVPGVPTLVLTGGWEPLYEEVAHFLASTGARHVVAGHDHRPQDGADGHAAIAAFLTETERAAA